MTERKFSHQVSNALMAENKSLVLPSLSRTNAGSQNAFVSQTIDFNVDLNEKVDKDFVVPKVKFDTIFEEYIDKQKQYEHLRSAVNKKDEGSSEQEIATLKTKLEQQKKIQKVELRHAKITA